MKYQRFWLNGLIRAAFGLAGFSLYRRRTMPRGIDLITDLQHLWSGRPPGVILDVGANQGQTSRLFAAAFPTTEIHAFEPVTATHAILLRQLSSLPRVRAHRLALGSRDGTALMEAEPGSGSNRLISGATLAAESPTEAVPLRRLDTFCEEIGLDTIALLKTDCEGHDLAVVQGAESLLRSGRIACVYCEVNFRRDGRHGDFFAIESYLRDLGYGFYALYDYSSREYDVPRVGFANALFVR